VRVLTADREAGPWYGKSVALFITNGTQDLLLSISQLFRTTCVIVDGDLGLQGAENQLECVLTYKSDFYSSSYATSETNLCSIHHVLGV
jgi:hypothetical protein